MKTHVSYEPEPGDRVNDLNLKLWGEIVEKDDGILTGGNGFVWVLFPGRRRRVRYPYFKLSWNSTFRCFDVNKPRTGLFEVK